MIVGIITIGNQFIGIDSPVPNLDDNDGLKVMDDLNHYHVDKSIFNSNVNDFDPKSDIATSIQLERKFFNAYYSTIKMILGMDIHNESKSEISKIVMDDNMGFFEKFDDIYRIIGSIQGEHVKFVEYSKSTLRNFPEINICKPNDKNKYCLLENGSQKILIPETNLYTGEKNEEKYLNKIVEKVIRDSFTFDDMFHNKLHYPKDNTRYTLNDNEILALESTLRNISIQN